MKKQILILGVMVMTAMTVLGGCSGAKKNEKEASTETMTNSKSQEDQLYTESQETKDLMKQVAEKDISLDYAKFLTDKPFAAASVFDLEENGDQRKAYAWLQTGEFVVVKDKSYRVSGNEGYAVIEYTKTGEDVTLDKITWEDDITNPKMDEVGDDLYTKEKTSDEWVQKNFSIKALRKAKTFYPYEGRKVSSLLDDKVEEELKVPVEKLNILEIDAEKGTYEISELVEKGNPDDEDYTMEKKVIESGKLEDFK